MKIKASISVLVGDDEKLLSQIKSVYFKNATIKLGKDDKFDSFYEKSEILKFLNRDERQEIRNLLMIDIKKKFRQSMKNILPRPAPISFQSINNVSTINFTEN